MKKIEDFLHKKAHIFHKTHLYADVLYLGGTLIHFEGLHVGAVVVLFGLGIIAVTFGEDVI